MTSLFSTFFPFGLGWTEMDRDDRINFAILRGVQTYVWVTRG